MPQNSLAAHPPDNRIVRITLDSVRSYSTIIYRHSLLSFNFLETGLRYIVGDGRNLEDNVVFSRLPIPLVRQYSVITKVITTSATVSLFADGSSRTLVIASAVPNRNSAVYNVSCILCSTSSRSQNRNPRLPKSGYVKCFLLYYASVCELIGAKPMVAYKIGDRRSSS